MLFKPPNNTKNGTENNRIRYMKTGYYDSIVLENVKENVLGFLFDLLIEVFNNKHNGITYYSMGSTI